MSNPNFINVNSPTFRDFLLNMNLPLKDSITDNSLQSNLVGIGKPVNIKYTNQTPNGENLLDEGDYQREHVNIPVNKFQGLPDDYQLFSVDNNIQTPQSVGKYDINSANGIGFPALGDVVLGQNKTISAYLSKNLYYDPTQVVKVDLNQDNSTIGNQFGSYLDKNGKLTFNDGINEPYGIVTSLLNGNGIGFGSNGLISNGDIRNTLVGRALSSAGVIDDTPLGRIGAQQLAIQLGNNALFHLKKETVGKLNTNVWSLFDNKDDSFLKPNYDITVPNGAFAKSVDFLADLGGFSLPKSQMDVSVFSFDDKFQYDGLGNIERANEMLKNTGIGQANALFSNLNANLANISEEAKKAFRYGYAPNFFKGNNSVNDYRLYAYYDGQGNVIEGDGGKGPFYKWTDTEGSGFDAKINSKFLNDEGDEITFTWYGDQFNSNLNETIRESDEYKKVGLPPIGDYTFFPNRKSLLYKTKQLFLNNKIGSLVAGHGIFGDEDSEIQNVPKYNDKAIGLSKGSGVLSGDFIRRSISSINRDDKPEDIFCRTWSPNKQYNSVNDQIKSRKLDEDGGNYLRRDNRDFSVLEDTGHVKIANYKTDKQGVKRYMFSIENLAYGKSNGILNLLPCEIGSYGGRIMWFPPYDISFNESVSVGWDKTNFIGRGEPIYTYNNTERTGSLSFKVIIDHPSYMNNMKDVGNEVFASIAAGCIDNVSEFLTPFQRQQIETAIKEDVLPEIVVYNNPNLPSVTHVFFPNDVAESYFTKYISYESGLYDYDNDKTILSPFDEMVIIEDSVDGTSFLTFDEVFKIEYDLSLKKVKVRSDEQYDYHRPLDIESGLGMETILSDAIVDSVPTPYKDTTNYGLNGNRFDGSNDNSFSIPESNGFKPKKPDGRYYGWTEPQYFIDLAGYLISNKNVKITFIGYASKVGSVEKNRELSKKRAEATLGFFKTKLKETKLEGVNDEFLNKRLTTIIEAEGETDYFSQQYDTIGNKVCNPNEPWSLACKLNRRVQIKFDVDNELLKVAQTSSVNSTVKSGPLSTKNPAESFYHYTECDHFEKLKETDKFIYNKLADKIKYFSPSFHSITPEGFNSRLTFLHQCTRQGETNYKESPTNLAFGKAPICVLRIGDFFHTKIAIENMSIDYEPLVWDINPEGVGVQPMIANVTLNIALIGGSSLDGPINKLQNAVSYNFYANTEIYDTRAESLFDFEEADKKKKDAQDLRDKQAQDQLANAARNKEEVIEEVVYDEKLDKELLDVVFDEKIIKEMDFKAVYNDGLFKNNVISTIKLKEKLSKDYTIKITVHEPDLDKEMGYYFVASELLTKDEKELELQSKNKVEENTRNWRNRLEYSDPYAEKQPWAYFFDNAFYFYEEIIDYDVPLLDGTKDNNISGIITEVITFKVDFILNDKLFYSKEFGYKWKSQYKSYKDAPEIDGVYTGILNRKIVGYKNGFDKKIKKVIVTGELIPQSSDENANKLSTYEGPSQSELNKQLEEDINKSTEAFTNRAKINNNYGFGKGESKFERTAKSLSLSNATKNFMDKNGITDISGYATNIIDFEEFTKNDGTNVYLQLIEYTQK